MRIFVGYAAGSLVSLQRGKIYGSCEFNIAGSGLIQKLCDFFRTEKCIDNFPAKFFY